MDSLTINNFMFIITLSWKDKLQKEMMILMKQRERREGLLKLKAGKKLKEDHG